jgi:hypothetical protein
MTLRSAKHYCLTLPPKNVSLAEWSLNSNTVYRTTPEDPAGLGQVLSRHGLAAPG